VEWYDSLHTKMLQFPDSSTVTGDFTQDPVLSKASEGIPPVVVDLAESNGVYTATLGTTTYEVALTLGGAWKQRYLTQIGSSLYVLPVQWNKETEKWVEYDLQHWFDTAGNAVSIGKSQSWDRRCAGCHTTGTDIFFNGREWVATYSELNIGCESCHGPGSDHVVNPQAVGNILNAARVSQERADEVCAQCHLRGESTGKVGEKTSGYPLAPGEVWYLPGDDLSLYTRDTGSRLARRYIQGSSPGVAGLS